MRCRDLARHGGASCPASLQRLARWTTARAMLLSVLAPTACRIGGSDATAPDPYAADMRAYVNGDTWFTRNKVTAHYVDNTLSFSGSDGLYLVSVSVPGVDGPGTYSLNAGNPFGAWANVSGGGKTWTTSLVAFAGSVTVTTLTATSASGTFQFLAQNLFDQRDFMQVGSGVFTVTY